MDKNVLGNKIKQLRKVKGLSQEKLGEKSDLTQQHISRIENGTVLPSISTLSKISKVFNIPIDDLADIDIRDREDKYTLAIIKKLDFLGIEDKCKVEGYTALANAIIEQAVDDYRRSKHYQEKTAIKKFFLSEWFSVLTDLDGKMILIRLEEERGANYVKNYRKNS